MPPPAPQVFDPQKSLDRVGLLERGQGEPIVMIHGVGLQKAAWEPQIRALSSDYRVLALDMPGHGESAPLPHGSALPDFVAWLDQCLDLMNIEAANLVGHSMGALVVGGLAATKPQRAMRVALLNPVFERSAEARVAVERRANRIADGVIDHEAPLDRWFVKDGSDLPFRQTVARWLKDADPQSYATAYRAFATGDRTYADAYKFLSCPLLALTGSDDANSTPEMSEKIAAKALNGRAVILEGHRHMASLTGADIVNFHLREWLQRSTSGVAAETS